MLVLHEPQHAKGTRAGKLGSPPFRMTRVFCRFGWGAKPQTIFNELQKMKVDVAGSD